MLTKYLLITVIILGALAIGGIAYLYADKKGYQNKDSWFLKGALLGFITLLIASVFVKKHKK